MKGAQAEIHIQVLRLRGELTAEDAYRIRGVVAHLVRQGHIHMALNLENVPAASLEGLSVLAEQAHRLREYGGDLVLVGAALRVLWCIDLAGLRGRFTLCASELEADYKFSLAPL